MTTEAPNPPIRVGDRVTWMSTRTKGSTIRFSTVEGIVKEFIGELAVVKPKRGGKPCAVLIKRLTPAGQKSELTRMFETAAEAVK